MGKGKVRTRTSGSHQGQKYPIKNEGPKGYGISKGNPTLKGTTRADLREARISNRQFIYGDFDKDGVTNIDDQKPFDHKDKKQVMEIKLSDELRKLESHSLRFSGSTKRVAKDLERFGHPVKYRIKNVNSIINKLRRRHIEKIEDIGGCMVLVRDKKEANEVGRYIEKRYSVIDKDDYYAKPKAGYEALHYTIMIEELPVEIQVKTAKDYEKHLEWHKSYKEGKFKAA